MEHPALSKYNDSITAILQNASGNQSYMTGWDDLLKGIQIMEGAHFGDKRKGNNSPYLRHQFEIISDYLAKYDRSEVNLHDILVFMLHDVIEDHPEYWQDILEQFGLQTFRDVLILSTGGIKAPYREEMLEFLIAEFGYQIGSIRPGTILYDILHILSPGSPLEKLKGYSQYSRQDNPQEFARIKWAIIYYAQYFLGVDPTKKNVIIEDEEYISLCNYVYMNRYDTRRKLQDMLNNMSDMALMGHGYIEKRQIKAYILAAKLRNFSMTDELAELAEKFQEAGRPMYPEAVIRARIQEKYKQKEVPNGG